MAPSTNFEAVAILVLMALDIWCAVDGCMRSDSNKESLTLVCPKDKEVVAEKRASVAPVSWTKDEFLVTTTYTLKGIYQTVPVYGAATDVSRFFHEGQHYVEYKAVDEAGHFNQCSFVITIRVRRCPAVSDPQFGTFTCTASNLFGSECSLSCIPGYSVSGVKIMDCLEDGSWSADVPVCRLTTCPDPGTPLFGTRSCSTDAHTYGSICSFQCPSDYQLLGNGRLICGSSGEWLASPPICQEIVPPQVKHCPPATVRTTTTTSHFAEVEKPPVVFVTEAGDEAQHTCSHFADDRRSRHNFTLGVHLVTCTAFDPSVGDRSVSKCEFHVHVKANPCHVLHQPSNGSLLCSRAHGGGRATYDTICQLFCHNGFAHGRSDDGAIAGEYRCDHTGNWLPYDIIPSCVVPKRPLELKLPSEIYYLSHSCPIDQAHTYEIRTRFQSTLQTMIRQVSPCAARPQDCIVEDTVVRCQLMATAAASPPSAIGGPSRRLRRYVSQSGLLDDKVPLAKTSGKSDSPQIRRSPSFRLTIQFHFGTRIPEVEGLWPDEYHTATERLFGMADHLERQLNRSLFDVHDRLDNIRMTPEPESLAYDHVRAVCDIGYSFNGSILQCVSCGPGSYYNTSQNRCVACHPETYQDEQAAFGCKRCPSGSATAYRGATDVLQCIDVDECLSRPCLNNGQCHNDNDRFTCTCLPGYSGVQCEEPVYDCKVHSCLSGGTCLPEGPDNYTCQCRPNYSGDYCQFATVDGGWSDWSEWSSCSKSCEVGEMTRSRSCDSPIPSHGGRACPNAAVEKMVCNLHACPKCTKLRRPYQGSVTCQVNATEDVTLCTIRCQDGHAFHGTVLPVYACGRSTSHLWPHQSPDNPRAVLPPCTVQLNPASVNYEFRSSLPLECASEETRAALQLIVDRRAKEATSGLDCLRQGSCHLNAPDIAGCRLEDVNAAAGNGGGRRKRAAIPRRLQGINVSVSLTYRTNNRQELELTKVKKEMQVLGADLLRESDEGSLYVEFNGSKVTLDSRQVAVFDSVTCHRGKMLSMDGLHCVACAPGSYFSSHHQQLCVLCEIGSFQPKPGLSECIQCPKGMVTFGRGAVGQFECYANDTQPPDIPEEYYYIKQHSSQGPNIAFVTVGGILMSAIILFTVVIFIVVWKRCRRSKAYSPTKHGNEHTQEQVHLCAITSLSEEKA